jgi:nitrate/nitrite transporter NarK
VVSGTCSTIGAVGAGIPTLKAGSATTATGSSSRAFMVSMTACVVTISFHCERRTGVFDFRLINSQEPVALQHGYSAIHGTLLLLDILSVPS